MKVLSDFPEDETRRSVASEAARRIRNNSAPWDRPQDYPCPNSSFALAINEILREKDLTLTSPEQQKRLLWEAFTCYKLHPTYEAAHEEEFEKDGPFSPVNTWEWLIYESLDLSFPVVSGRQKKWRTVGNKETGLPPSKEDVLRIIDGCVEQLEQALNIRWDKLESLYKQKSHSESQVLMDVDMSMKTVWQKRDVLWSLCYVSGYPNPAEAPAPGGHIYPQSPLHNQYLSEFQPSSVENFLWPFVPKRFRDEEGELFYHTFSGDISPLSEGVEQMYQLMYERKLLLWYFMKKKIIESERAPNLDIIQALAWLNNEIESCQLKLATFPSEPSRSRGFSSGVSHLDQTLSQLANIIFSLKPEAENLWFMKILSTIIALLQSFLSDSIQAVEDIPDEIERGYYLAELKNKIRKDMITYCERLQSLYESWENTHPMHNNAQKVLKSLGKLRIT